MQNNSAWRRERKKEGLHYRIYSLTEPAHTLSGPNAPERDSAAWTWWKAHASATVRHHQTDQKVRSQSWVQFGTNTFVRHMRGRPHERRPEMYFTSYIDAYWWKLKVLILWQSQLLIWFLFGLNVVSYFHFWSLVKTHLHCVCVYMCCLYCHSNLRHVTLSFILLASNLSRTPVCWRFL